MVNGCIWLESYGGWLCMAASSTPRDYAPQRELQAARGMDEKI
jgi:hypothetical protein